MHLKSRFAVQLALSGLLALSPAWALAQQPSERPAAAARTDTAAPPVGPGASGPVQYFPSVGEQPRLPPDSTTKQTLPLPDRPLNFSATAGSIRLFNDKGEPEA